jgi:hypothetical protein
LLAFFYWIKTIKINNNSVLKFQNPDFTLVNVCDF